MQPNKSFLLIWAFLIFLFLNLTYDGWSILHLFVTSSLKVEVENCDCVKSIRLNENKYSDISTENLLNYSDTTCSKTAFARGFGQKLVTFSFYYHKDGGHTNRYFEGNF